MTDTKSTSRFVGVLESVVQNRQKETEKVLGFCSTLVKHFVKVRDQRDDALAQVAELNRQLKAKEDELSRQKEVNKRLDNDISALISAVEIAAQEIAQSDAYMMNRVVALGDELKIPVNTKAPADIDSNIVSDKSRVDSKATPAIDVHSNKKLMNILGNTDSLH